MTVRAKVHLCCLVVVVVCEIQTAAMRYFADLVGETEKSHV